MLLSGPDETPADEDGDRVSGAFSLSRRVASPPRWKGGNPLPTFHLAIDTDRRSNGWIVLPSVNCSSFCLKTHSKRHTPLPGSTLIAASKVHDRQIYLFFSMSRLMSVNQSAAVQLRQWQGEEAESERRASYHVTLPKDGWRGNWQKRKILARREEVTWQQDEEKQEFSVVFFTGAKWLEWIR